MNNNDFTSNNESQPVLHETKLIFGIRAEYFFTLVLLILLVVASIGIYFFYAQQTLMKNNTQQTESFSNSIEKGGQILAQEGSAEAALHFNNLVNIATTPSQEGQAKLNLGFVRLSEDRVGAVGLLKEVVANETYDDFTRAKAANHILNEYTATGDDEFARKYIFTGPIWGEFAAQDLGQAILNGFLYSANLRPTPEANMRIATEYAFEIAFSDLSQEQKDANAALALDYLQAGDTEIDALLNSNQVTYGGTSPANVAAAMNRRSMALDTLYNYGYIANAESVKESYREAISYIIDNGDTIGFGTEAFIRYNYADFLTRLDSETEARNIQTVLAPFLNLDRGHNFTSFADERLSITDVADRPTQAIGHPDTMRTIISISEDFRQALRRVGIQERLISGS